MLEVNDMWRLVCYCYDEVVGGRSLCNVALPELTDVEWCNMTAALLAWHDRVTKYAVAVCNDGCMRLDVDVTAIAPKDDAILEAYNFLSAMSRAMEEQQRWREHYHTLFEKLAVQVLPENMPIWQVVRRNHINRDNLQQRSLDQIDAWLFGEAGKRRVNESRSVHIEHGVGMGHESLADAAVLLGGV